MHFNRRALKVKNSQKVVGQRREELVGRAVTSAAVRLQGEPHRPPPLRWLPLHRAQLHAGDLLFSAEVLQVGTNEDVAVETWSTREGVVVPIPVEIRPRIITYKLEAVFWGVRRLRRVQLLPVSRPRVALQVAGRRLCSAVIPDTAANPNFPNPRMVFTLELPEQEEYLPPLQVEVHDCRSFGREVLAGVHALHSLADFVVPPPPYLTDKQLSEIQQGLEKGHGAEEPPAIAVKREIRKTMTAVRHLDSEDVPTTPEPKKDEPERKKKGRLGIGLVWRRKHAAPTIAEEEIEAPDWWTKYYASLPQAERDRKLSLAGHVGAEATEPVEKLELYPCELEKLSQFSGLQDWLRCFSLHKGKRAGSGRSPVVGHVKAALCLYPSPFPERPAVRLLSRHENNAPVRVCVRCYCVRATELHPRDPTGLSDPYVEMRVGGQVAGSRDDYVPQQIEPVFGRLLQLECVLPRDWQLSVRVMDWDRTTRDDLIGETRIDLEQRLLSDHRAHCGLPPDERRELKEHLRCRKGYNAWRDAERPTQILEGLCRRQGLRLPEYLADDTLSVAGATYSLPLTDQSAAERRSSEWREQLALEALRAWRPRLVAEHVERRPLLHAAFPGLAQGFLHLWLDLFPLPSAAALWVPEQKPQSTDVHYRSLNGEAMFNWRFVFPLCYLPGERRLLVQHRSGPMLGRSTRRTAPPRLHLQVWDSDHFSPDDFLGAVTLNLWQLPVGAPSAKQCSLAMLERGAPTVNLFRARRAHGWWPFRTREENEYKIAGKVELVLEVLTSLEAEARPAGKGRQEPDALEKPK
ncbi:otoferlin-like [Schistocerca serialis cubense]|uniref:otoferlin-like n=1 Tax=Schistocerca serialis cubense TaxID=2023355 RepID=UPI00214F5519|nr:otoferlin-like [Schistocerca serialis cubense]